MGNEPLLHSMLAQRSSCSEVSCTSDFAPINMVKNSDKKGPCGYSVRAQHTLGYVHTIILSESLVFFLAILKTWRVNNRTSLTELFDTGEKDGKSLLVTAERELYPDRASMKVENGRESIAVGQILKGARNNKKQSDMLLQAPSTEVVSFENSDVYKVTLFLISSRSTRNRYLSMMSTTGSWWCIGYCWSGHGWWSTSIAFRWFTAHAERYDTDNTLLQKNLGRTA